MRRHDDVAPGPAVGQAELVQQVVRSGAADDARRVQAPALADRRAQPVGAAVGVAIGLPSAALTIAACADGGTPNAPSFDDSFTVRLAPGSSDSPAT